MGGFNLRGVEIMELGHPPITGASERFQDHTVYAGVHHKAWSDQSDVVL